MASTFDACVIGHVARDINTIGDTEYAPCPGGAAYYSTMVYRGLGLRAAVVTRVAERDRHLLQELEDAGVEVFNLPSAGHDHLSQRLSLGGGPRSADPAGRCPRRHHPGRGPAGPARPDLADRAAHRATTSSSP